MNISVHFIPLAIWPVLGIVFLLVMLPCGIALLQRGRGAWARLAGFVLLFAILAGPQLDKNTTSPLPDSALVLVDHSASMSIGGRSALAARALAALRASAGATRLDIVDIPPADSNGTTLEPALQNALSQINQAQLAGIIAITDGQISGLPSLPKGVPFTALLTAAGEETDRAIRFENAPSFGLVGQQQRLTLVVSDHGRSDSGSSASITLTEDGRDIATRSAPVGQPVTFNLPISHAGPIVITASTPPLRGEVSLINNQAAFTLTGIQKHLNILLISGSPGQGERAWRLLLKSDPAVELVHFTILRTPGEAIDADPEEIALVPFPVRELFETDIAKFNLIILDGFNITGLLSPEYLANIAAYVKNGGALLTEVGPEFFGPDSLANSPLAAVLPAIPAATGTIEESFSPTITSIGFRHPVTAPFANQVLSQWYRIESTTPTSGGDVLMSGPNKLPLLILSTMGKGRSGILLSDQLWLWTRGGTHAGPALPLLRRLVYWLLREPALEANALNASISNDRLTVTRQTLSSSPPGPATVLAPDHVTTQLPLRQTAAGRFAGTASIKSVNGVWKITEDGLTAYAANNEGNLLEYQDLAATATKLRPVATKLLWLGRNAPLSLSSFLSPRHAVQITGTRAIPLFPPLPTLFVALGLITLAWWREGRNR